MDEIQEVVPIKSEPQESSSRSHSISMSNTGDNQEIFSSQTLATNADSVEYDENIYDDYYADDHYAVAGGVEYAVADGGVESSKGEQVLNVAIVQSQFILQSVVFQSEYLFFCLLISLFSFRSKFPRPQ
jgi:hypothetical protein